MEWSKSDRKFMKRALLLAAKGEGRVSPNPLVGAVVVKKGRIIGEGYHEKFGGPHAEANALRGIDAAGATMYVTLEPCCPCVPKKKTPACTPLIVRSGVTRVVIGARDIHPNVCGIEELRASGIRVEEGLLEEESKRLNEPFIWRLKTGRAFSVAKMAQSLNGRIGIRGKARVWLSGKEFDKFAQVMRSRYDAILVGINTVLEDDPALTCRIKGGRNPARIILDSALRVPLGAKALKNAKREKVIVVSGKGGTRGKAAALRKMGVQVLPLGNGRVSIKKLLYLLPKLGINSVIIEGGAKVTGSALAEGAVDKAVVAVSRKKILGRGAVASPFTKKTIQGLSRRKMGKDTVYEGYLSEYSK